jgi:putative endonuclease
MNPDYYIYLLTNKYSTVLYTGVTNDLGRRVDEHKSKLHEGFTKKYNVDRLVYYEVYSDINDAIDREKKLKNGHVKRK